MKKVDLKLSGIIILLVLVLFNTFALGQEYGKIAGTVVDSETGEALIGVNVYTEGTNLGSATDIEGNYSIDKIPVGSYNMIFSMIGYQKKTVTGVEVISGQTTKIDITLGLESIETDEVVVTAKLLENTEASMLIKRQKAIQVSDAISAEQISRTGSGDAADAVKQVVGASIVDGKYVYVRGLGDRYSSAQMNGAELPSSDPDKKAFQLDLLPANLLENITTIKTFTPDKPGNFSGGIVDVGTKNFPDGMNLKVSASASYNTQASFNNNFLSYDGGSTDWLGFDDGSRDIPAVLEGGIDNISPASARTNQEKAQKLDSYSKSFDNTMNFFRETPPVNQSFGLSFGNKIKTGESSSLGYLGSLTYSRSFSFYENGSVGRYTMPDESSETLNPELLLNDNQATQDADLGGLLTLAYNINPEHQIGGNIFYSNSGSKTTRLQTGKWPHQFGLQDNRIISNRVLDYKQRNILSYQFRGEHHLKSFLSSIAEWSVSIANTSQEEPDRRLIFSYYDPDTESYNIVGSNFDDPARYFRSLDDESRTYNLSFSAPFEQWSGLKSKLKIGGYYQNLSRTFDERIFTYNIPNNRIFNNVNGDVSALLSDENMGITGIDTLSNGKLKYTFGNTIRDNSKDFNNYEGSQNISAYYTMLELPIYSDLRFIGGVRYERTNMEVISGDSTKTPGNISEEDFLPSVNFIYNLMDNMNLRLAGSQTLARPIFREMAPYASKEFVNGIEFVGNPELQRTLIQNYDLRWEWFMRPGEIFAVSAFYKKMKNPIERTFDEGASAANQIVTYENVDKAIIQGLEFETRIRLDYLWEELGDFTFGGNLSLVNSKIDLSEVEINIRKVRNDNSTTRDLQGQSPYILNLDLSYVNESSGTSANLHYNIFGERLAFVTAPLVPDVYEQPAQTLDLNISQELVEHLTVKLGVSNILNAGFKQVYRYKGKDYNFLSYDEGRNITLGLSYSL